MKIKVLSWNIWAGKYLDKVIDQLKEIDADIIGLQEVKEIKLKGNRANIAQDIAQKLGYEFFYCKAFTDDRHGSDYSLGNAVLSKFPIKETRCIELSGIDEYKGDSLTEPRNAVKAAIEIDGKLLNVLVTHLGWNKGELKSTEIQISQTDKLIQNLPNENTVLMGDFNSRPETEVLKKITKLLVNTDNDLEKITWFNPENLEQFPKCRIDYIFVTSDLKFKNFQILPTQASDHLPLLVELEIHQ